MAAPRPIQIRAATSANPAPSAISIGWNSIRNCGTPKSNSAWKIEIPIKSPAIKPTRRAWVTSEGAERSPRRVRRCHIPSRSSTACPTRVMAAPPSIIRWVGPHSVTS
jgi:hypothetical protein